MANPDRYTGANINPSKLDNHPIQSGDRVEITKGAYEDRVGTYRFTSKGMTTVELSPKGLTVQVPVGFIKKIGT